MNKDDKFVAQFCGFLILASIFMGWVFWVVSAPIEHYQPGRPGPESAEHTSCVPIISTQISGKMVVTRTTYICH